MSLFFTPYVYPIFLAVFGLRFPPWQRAITILSFSTSKNQVKIYSFGTSKNYVGGVALRATTNPAAWRIACRRLASSIPRPASRHCLDSHEISAAPFGFHHAAGREKRPSPHTKLHEKHDKDIAPCKRPSPHTKTPALQTSRKGHRMWNLAASGFRGQMARAFNWPIAQWRPWDMRQS